MAPAVTADVPDLNAPRPDYLMCSRTLQFKDKALNQAFLREWVTINLVRLDRIYIVFCLLVIFAVIATVHDHDLPTRVRLHSWFLTFIIWGWFSLMRSPFAQRMYIQYRSHLLILLRLILLSPGDCVIERIHTSDHARPAAEFLRLLLFKTQALTVVVLALGNALPFHLVLAMQPYHLQYLWFNSRGVSEQLCAMQAGWVRAAQWGLSWCSTLLQPLTQGLVMELQKELAGLRPASEQQDDTAAQLGAVSNTTVHHFNASLGDVMQCANASVSDAKQSRSYANQNDVMHCSNVGWNGAVQSCHNASWDGTMQCSIAGQNNAPQWLNAGQRSTPQQVVTSQANGMLSPHAPGCPGEQLVWFVVLSLGVVLPVVLAYQLEAAARREFLKARGLVGSRQGWWQHGMQVGEMGGRRARWIESMLWWWQLGAVLAMLWQLLDLAFW